MTIRLRIVGSGFHSANNANLSPGTCFQPLFSSSGTRIKPQAGNVLRSKILAKERQLQPLRCVLKCRWKRNPPFFPPLIQIFIIQNIQKSKEAIFRKYNLAWKSYSNWGSLPKVSVNLRTACWHLCDYNCFQVATAPLFKMRTTFPLNWW
jgi:hypothetical protein